MSVSGLPQTANPVTLGRARFGYRAGTMSGISSMGSLPSVFQGASATISRAVAGASQDAAAIASPSADPSAMLAALIDARQQLTYTQAGAKMMNTASEMLGSIIDISA